jgi:SpoVK/Ycf46/Vps4 family AAA+-type ATPase
LQVSAGDLSNDPKVLETQLSHISECAERWKAVLLLDEADVYLSQRSHDHLHNSLVSVFLRKLEYYEGIMFLTTNRLKDFDEAILSRLHLTLKYSSLSTDTKKAIWKSFLGKAVVAEKGAIYSPEQLNDLAKKDFNGREVCLYLLTSCSLSTMAISLPGSDQKLCQSSACFGN